MSALAKLLEESTPPANSAKTAKAGGEISNASEISRGVVQQTRLERRRRAVLSRLEKAPSSVRACWITDDKANAEFVVVVLAIRDVGASSRFHAAAMTDSNCSRSSGRTSLLHCAAWNQPLSH
jgi:hypothetical protein